MDISVLHTREEAVQATDKDYQRANSSLDHKRLVVSRQRHGVHSRVVITLRLKRIISFNSLRTVVFRYN